MPLSANGRGWLRLRHLPGSGPRALGRIMERFPSPEAALEADPSVLKRLGLPDPALSALARAPGSEAPHADIRWLEAPGRYLLALPDPEYPERLGQIPDPPPLVYVEGDPSALDPGPVIALVGTRSPSRAGERTARIFARDLAASGFTIVSGLARGIDAAAHRGALEASGRTVAVQGCGPDRVYPPEHSRLAREITESGALVTEFPAGTPPRGQHFPQRNRIVSGLALGTLVIEAGPRSGALTTARCAGRQGREVWAVPGSINNPLSRGSHRLLREGAKLVENLTDITEELPRPARVFPPEASSETIEALPGLTSDQHTVLRCVDHEPTALEDVAARCGLTPNRVSAILLELEIRGVVTAEPGGFFTRLPEEGTRRP